MRRHHTQNTLPRGRALLAVARAGRAPYNSAMKPFAWVALLACALVSSAPAARADELAAPQVTLLSAGAGKKAPLRYQLAAGSKQTLTMTMDMQLAMFLRAEPGAAETPLPRARAPKTRFTIDLNITSVAADGDLTLTYRYRRFEVLPDAAVAQEILAATAKSLAELEGVAGHMVVSSRGFVKEHRLDLPATLSPQAKESLKSFKRSMGQMAAPLPQEPVGKGARWQVKTQIELNGAVLDVVTVSKLVERKGKRAKLELAIEQTSGRQALEVNGIKSELVSALFTASGLTLIDLGALAPRSATVKGNGTMQFEALGQGIKVELSLDVAMAGKP